MLIIFTGFAIVLVGLGFYVLCQYDKYEREQLDPIIGGV